MSDGPADLVVAGGDVLVAPGDLHERCDLLIADGRVAGVEPAPSSARDTAGAVLDASGLLAVPGLVNAHTHSPENPMRGLADGLALEPWLARLFGESGTYSEEDHYWCALASAAEGLCGGTTAIVDHLGMTPPRPEAIDGAMRAYSDAGVRGGVAPLITDADATVALAADLGVDVGGVAELIPGQRSALPAAEIIALTDAAIVRWHGAEGGRLHLLSGAAGVQWASGELLAAAADLARRRRTTMQLHLLETRLQAAACRLRFGRSGVQALDALDVLGPEVSLAHAVWIDDEDIALIARRRAVVVHNPAANLRLRSGRAPVAQLLDAGVDVALGTDGAASSDDQTTWIAMRLAGLLHRGADEPWVRSAQALTMATVGGGRVLGLPELGTLAPGAPADVALLDRLGAGLAGARELEAALVLSETGAGVRHVLVAGEVVLRDGRPTRFDLGEVRAAMAEQAARRRRDGPLPAPLVSAIDRIDAVRAALAAREGRPFVRP